MKKIISTAIVLSIAASGYAQGFYFRAGFGYAFPGAGQTTYDNGLLYNGGTAGYNGSRNNSLTSTTQDYSIKGASFSSGLSGSLDIGYMVNNNIGIQLDANFGLSNTKYTFTDNNLNLNTAASPLPGSLTTTVRAKSPFLLLPSLVIQSGGEKINLYTRLGLALPLNTKMTEDQVIANAPGTGAITTDDFTWSIQNSFSLGFAAAAGVRYQVSDKVSIWGEISILSMSAYIKQADLQSWVETSGGVAQNVSLSSYAPNPTTITYGKSGTLDSSLANQPTYAQPFSNIGINFGVSFNLSNGSSRHSGMRHEDENEDEDNNNKPFRRR